MGSAGNSLTARPAFSLRLIGFKQTDVEGKDSMTGTTSELNTIMLDIYFGNADIIWVRLKATIQGVKVR